jgi:ubiquinone/menaquinone biosynthesis C-methylase UbiE
VYGDDYPEEARPRSFITLSELRRITGELRVGPGQTIVDLGHGWGGPGLWVARDTGASLVGIDLSDVGVARAREHAAEVGLADRARFEVRDLTATGLPDAGIDGAMSVDVLWSVPNKLAALREIARILRPGARLVFTNWDRDLSPPGYLPPLPDHRPLLEAAGFDVESYEVQPDGECLRGAYYERLVAAEADLLREIGGEETRKLMASARGNLGLVDGTRYLDHSRRILVVASKRRAPTSSQD